LAEAASLRARSRPRFAPPAHKPTFFHAAEAIHGDLGMLASGDIVLALSYSGETEELLRLLPTLKRLNAKLIAISGCGTSTLAQASDIFLDTGVSTEACPLNLATHRFYDGHACAGRRARA